MFAAVKDPQATLDYRFDWSAWLTPDTISSVTWTVPAGITQTAATNTTTTATIWLSGGTVGTRYTIDTVKLLQQRFPQVQFVWLMGSDNLENFHLWRDWQGIARAVTVAVVQRPGSIMAAVHAAPIRRFGVRRVTDGKLPRPPAILILDGARNPQSATRLRALGQIC